jgi:putative ABC transport system permease protein
MLKNYFQVALRNLLRNKSASLIKVISLSVGMICFAIISLFVYHELSYDRFHDHPEQVYRVVKDFVNDDGSRVPDATTPPALSPAIQKDLPEVAYTARVFPNWGRKYLISWKENQSYEEKVVRIDSSFFDIFSFQFVKGDKATAISKWENFIVITESTAKRYFGDADPIGMPLKLDIGQEGTDFFVSGVLKDVPETSHFTFDFLIPIRSVRYAQLDTDWDWYNFYTYVRLKPYTDPALFQSKLQQLFKKSDPESLNEYYAQLLTDIHLKSNLKWELSTNGDYSYIRILATIAIFVVILAAINYINLVTAQSARRAKEVGIRKVSGAVKSTLINQFLMESVMLSTLATFISIAAVETLLPLFSNLFGSTLSFFEAQNTKVLWLVTGVGISTGLIAGLYPAFYLSSFQPVKVLKGSLSGFAGDAFLRKGLVTFQFVISTVLIIGTFVISSQIDFVRNKKLGFGKDNVMVIHNTANLQNRDALLTEIRKATGVEQAGGADGTLGGQNWTTSVESVDGENELLLNFLSTDYDFLKVMRVEFLEGRNFSRETAADSSAIVLNETAVRQLGLKEPYSGQRISYGEDNNGVVQYGNVIGVIRDFHFTSFHEPIKPFGFFLIQNRINKFFITTDGSDLTQSIAEVQKIWTTLVPNRPFEFTFQDEQVAKLYASEVKFQTLFSNFTFVAIVIACLGLFGLSAYTAQQRTKEIGIRKTLGASVLGVTQLLSKEFLKLSLISVLISIPIAWYAMHQWLQNFAYHVELNAWMFVISAVVAVAIALATVSIQSIKAALANPVDSLRSE